MTAVTASWMSPQSPFQEWDRNHRLKNVTVVTALRMLPQPPRQKCYRCDRVKEGAAVTAPKMLPLRKFLHLSTPLVLVSDHSHTLFGVFRRDNSNVVFFEGNFSKVFNVFLKLIPGC